MLTEQFVASIAVAKKAPNASHVKDVGIFLYESQPQPGQRNVLKKSATAPNCLAVSDTHVFAAQADRAIVHVYNREKNNQEATVPFPELITSITLAFDDTILILGTTSGQVFLWETTTGRLMTANSSHLQKITVLAADSMSLFFLSGSTDSSINVWSTRNLLSFSASQLQRRSDRDIKQPIHSLTSHRGEITSIVCGNGRGSDNIAVSASSDKSVIVWNYQAGHALRTFLLDDIPRALAIDVLSRGFYTAYDDGSVQQINFYDLAKTEDAQNIASSASEALVVQPGTKGRWRLHSQESEATSLGAAQCLMLSWDSTRLFSGHSTGTIATWQVGNGECSTSLASLPGPVTNLHPLPVNLPGDKRSKMNKALIIVKPRTGALDDVTASCPVPQSYAMNMQFLRSVQEDDSIRSDFSQALTAPYFSHDLLEEGIAELNASANVTIVTQGQNEEDPDFMSLDMPTAEPRKKTLEDENEELRQQVISLQQVSLASLKTIKRLQTERDLMMAERSQEREQQNGMH